MPLRRKKPKQGQFGGSVLESAPFRYEVPWNLAEVPVSSGFKQNSRLSLGLRHETLGSGNSTLASTFRFSFIREKPGQISSSHLRR